MPVSSTINRERYATDGVTVAYTIHFSFFDDTDINAIFVSSGGVETTLALNTDFTVAVDQAANGDYTGGTLTTTPALTTGGTLTIYRAIPFTQEARYVENDPMPASTTNNVADRSVILAQQNADAQARSLTFPVTIGPTVSAELPTPVADAVLGWSSDGLSLENKTLAAGTAVYSSVANTIAGTATAEAVTPASLAALWTAGADNASGATITMGSGGSFNLITSTTAITAFAFTNDKAGRKARIRFSTARTLTYNATSLILPTAANITTVAGDSCEIESLGSGNFRVNQYTRADGSALATSGGYVTTAITRAVTSADNGKTINFSAGTTSATLPAAASNAGLKVTLKNSAASGDVTIDPNASETLDGQTTRLLRPGDRVTIVCTGSAWITVDGEYGYDSGQQTVTASAKLTLAHGLGVSPERLRITLVCITTDLNYAVNDEVDVNYASTNGSFQFTPVTDATNVNLIVSATIYIIDKTGFSFASITTAKWKWRVRAWTR